MKSAIPNHNSGLDDQSWNRIVASLPHTHVLQTWQWGQIKAAYGWKPLHLTWPSGGAGASPGAAALLLRRTVPLAGFAAKLRVLYVPKGPLLDWEHAPLRDQVLSEFESLARRLGAIFIKIDPDLPVGTGIPNQSGSTENLLGAEVAADLTARGWRYSNEQIQFRNTVLVDLAPAEEELLGRMKQKTRYNINLARRRGVEVRPGFAADLPLLYQMYAETSVRDGFVIRERDYYLLVWRTFLEAGIAEPLVAEVAGEPVAGLVVFRFGSRAWYLYGMSRAVHREKMPNYLLQWEAMRRAKAAGCVVYDLWGAPEVFDENDPLWGVYRFKEGLGGQVVRYLGAWDLPVHPFLYRMYTRTLPRLLGLMRRRGQERTRQVFGGSV